VAKVMISIPNALLKKVDRAAKKHRRSRSEVVREALRADLTSQAAQRRAWKNALAPLRKLERQWVGQWDSTDIVRYYRDTRYGREDRR
jgi:Arc/MetJ-type ribon-helix-helix transcriptional regulator